MKYSSRFPLTAMFDVANAQDDNVALFRLTTVAQALAHDGSAVAAHWLAYVWLAEHLARAR